MTYVGVRCGRSFHHSRFYLRLILFTTFTLFTFGCTHQLFTYVLRLPFTPRSHVYRFVIVRVVTTFPFPTFTLPHSHIYLTFTLFTVGSLRRFLYSCYDFDVTTLTLHLCYVDLLPFTRSLRYHFVTLGCYLRSDFAVSVTTTVRSLGCHTFWIWTVAVRVHHRLRTYTCLRTGLLYALPLLPRTYVYLALLCDFTNTCLLPRFPHPVSFTTFVTFSTHAAPFPHLPTHTTHTVTPTFTRPYTLPTHDYHLHTTTCHYYARSRYPRSTTFGHCPYPVLPTTLLLRSAVTFRYV